MQGDSEVIEALNAVLTAELTAINQYFIHHKMCENWGYERLSKKKYEESVGEMKDADAVIGRILYFDGVPNVQRLDPVRVGEDPIEQHKLDRLGSLALPMDRSAAKIPGLGDVDWGVVHGELYRQGYEGDCIIEHEDRRFEGSDEKVKQGFLIARDVLRPLCH